MGMNPIPGVSAVRAWEAPADGTAHLTHVLESTILGGLGPCDDGADLAFYRNDELIWGPEHLDTSGTSFPLDLTIAVNAGDMIYCRVSEPGPNSCDGSLVMFRVGFVASHPSGTTYIHFNDNSASELLCPYSFLSSGREWVSVSDGMGHFRYDDPSASLVGWDGNTMLGGAPALTFQNPVMPITGDFTAQILFPDVSQIAAVEDALMVGIGVEPEGGGAR